MPTMHPCEPVDVTYTDTARFRFANSVAIPASPRQLFEIFEDADSWPRWAGVITKVAWTSQPPYGVGTTRTVHMLGGLVGEEEFLAWEPERRMAFRFNASSTKGIHAFAEADDIEPTDSGCRLTWTLAMHGNAATNLSISAVRPVMNLLFRQFLRRLSALAAQRYPGATR
ncbi:SRPBCC family protein [Dietzia psychralcaliphila]|uniref:Polyketide cyclase n=1 Tax=Dietzia psychralcaliphila TaxID=139021 RepID=A0AAD0JVW7_9ACTN|nr:SRPBCC family protein [Dietzia psychralcaliphila]AWH96436.1 polyketide cyclase [Dietzia psychralcaliphila]PTM90420.1 polyketide cyclase/dehydrase/lipid transport protein [Dietzia psychralcaliphila]